jgi:hypothetical protein
MNRTHGLLVERGRKRRKSRINTNLNCTWQCPWDDESVRNHSSGSPERNHEPWQHLLSICREGTEKSLLWTTEDFKWIIYAKLNTEKLTTESLTGTNQGRNSGIYPWMAPTRLHHVRVNHQSSLQDWVLKTKEEKKGTQPKREILLAVRCDGLIQTPSL